MVNLDKQALNQPQWMPLPQSPRHLVGPLLPDPLRGAQFPLLGMASPRPPCRLDI
jgi:hypothetical protein